MPAAATTPFAMSLPGLAFRRLSACRRLPTPATFVGSLPDVRLRRRRRPWHATSPRCRDMLRYHAERCACFCLAFIFASALARKMFLFSDAAA